ncbi:MAG: nuclease A inhibitor family protein [Myxococcota bacterium]|jgi:hypothetical protein|nr:nuclease A inhibitor family protein [Myxococcota bacterium]
MTRCWFFGLSLLVLSFASLACDDSTGSGSPGEGEGEGEGAAEGEGEGKGDVAEGEGEGEGSGREDTDRLCHDGIDNDGDGYRDCADFDCARNPAVTVCGGENHDGVCADGVDNDSDGYTDCLDFDCSRNPAVTVCATGEGEGEGAEGEGEGAEGEGEGEGAEGEGEGAEGEGEGEGAEGEGEGAEGEGEGAEGEGEGLCAGELTEALTLAVDDLWFTSESDYLFDIRQWPGEGNLAPSESQVRRLAAIPADALFEERDFVDFFENLTTPYEGAPEEEIATCARYAELQQLLEAHLEHLVVYRFGEIEIDVFILGTTRCGELFALHTVSIET